ncbi:MAG TPA: hypothetical protein VF652_03135 [Allosphingosinicella sp.]
MAMDQVRLIELLEISAGTDPGGTENAVVELLRRSSFYAKHKQPLVRIGAAASDARPEALARTLIACAGENGSAYAAGALEALFGVDEVTTATYAYVENVYAPQAIDLGSDVMALPDTDAPDIHFAEAIGAIRGGLSRRRGAILVARQTASPFVPAPSKDEGPMAFSGMDLKVPGEDRIQAALQMITLCGPSPPAIRAMTTIAETDALRLFGVGAGISFHYPGYWVPGLPVPIATEVREMIPLYSALTASDRRRVDTAISRLRLATARLEPSDAIVDLAIALEAILSDKGNKDELTYRLRLRLALILESEVAERKRIKALVTSLYKERSGIVHGDVPGTADVELRRNGEGLVTRLIRKMLHLGFVPDWSLVELSGGQQMR